MEGSSSNVMAVLAMGLSSLTTYLTFFDTSYVLTAANANVVVQVQSGGGTNNGVSSASFNFFVRPSLIMSNRGKLAIVVSDVSLFRSTDREICRAADGDEGVSAFRPRGGGGSMPMIIEPETLKHLELEFGLEPVRATAGDGASFDIPADDGLWCLKWTVFDPNGQRKEVSSPVLTMKTTYMNVDDRRYPKVKIDKDFPKGPLRLIERSLF